MNRRPFLPCGFLLGVWAVGLWGCYWGIPCERAGDDVICMEQKANCGSIVVTDSCGYKEIISCGKCFGPDLCGGSGKPNECQECDKKVTVKTECTSGWCTIPGGCFSMGTTRTEPNCLNGEGLLKETAHEVALPHKFQMMESEVTQKQFLSLMGYHNSQNMVGASSEKGTWDKHPVEYVNWYEAAAYANRLSHTEGLDPCYQCDDGTGSHVRCAVAQTYSLDPYLCPGYRLPTEAEWEYAFRAGSAEDFYAHKGGPAVSLQDTECNEDKQLYQPLDAIAWYGMNSSGAAKDTDQHHAVMQKNHNNFGLLDMAGNVWEWTMDWAQADLGSTKQSNPWGPASGTLKVLRGGSYGWKQPKYFRASARRAGKGDTPGSGDSPDHACGSVGFRLVRTLP